MPYKHVRRMSTKKSYKKNSTKTTPEFRKKVLTVVKRTQEVKVCMMNDQLSQLTFLYNPAGPTPPFVIDLDTLIFDNIPQGVGEHERIGDKIAPSKVSYEGFMVISDATATYSRPTYIRMIILKDKLNQSVNNFGDLFESAGTNPASAPLNTLLDITSRVNSDRYTVLTQRVFKLGASTGATVIPNNDFKVSKFFKVDLTKHMKKIEFDASGLTSPSNLQVVFVGSYADNGPIVFSPSYTGPATSITSTLRISYRDA